MPSAAISSANKEVKDLVVRESDSQLTNGPVKRPRGQYLSYTEEEKVESPKEQLNLASRICYNIYDMCGFIPLYNYKKIIRKLKVGVDNGFKISIREIYFLESGFSVDSQNL